MAVTDAMRRRYSFGLLLLEVWTGENPFHPYGGAAAVLVVWG